ncbi:para-aminobenzoate synthetase component 1 [Roseivirga ehrenbergii]|uniref:Aminobenzoate synthetase n=1 Tax=Roseivirga ehrenbergii (strain DSM 102268 / JCM 13514 / KCTC 12282 / NCIMB 14502 / KMM 6017) TaxID=279360 RepID=A0A150X6U3_ROSEK|nr:anthranilate synthase component I family protein [Roseivirga ehrenbergii]KYG74459.1 aminobenzoate synthetase [Roseivirga ehrenbergii]TCL14235.1 para-aminobenzoate synthetase component 1 [Roseivirga ehrenbergii]
MKTTSINNKPQFLEKALHWANNFSHCAYFQSNGIPYPYQGFNEILAVGAKRIFKPNENDRFEALSAFHQNKWLFGYLGYDLKNDTENLSSSNSDHVQFPEISFFEAQHLLLFKGNEVEIRSEEDVLGQIENTEINLPQSKLTVPKASITKAAYLDIIEKLRQHIEEGDCYEINFCQEFHGEIECTNPIQLYSDLNKLSPSPFSSFQKHNDHYILSASPERFMKKEGDKIISQPIKGTRPRGKSKVEDEALKKELRSDEKELAENMMIVDLVRNDLARSSKIGSVKVEEIFGIYSFQQVHQMISTIVSEKREDVSAFEVIKSAFPMGSMTGAPKVKVMELIEQYESTKRGAFSGAAGYISPNGDFDFNVLIRSLFLNSASKTYSFQAGSAITYDSIPEKEYEECMVKAKAIISLIQHGA